MIPDNLIRFVPSFNSFDLAAITESFSYQAESARENEIVSLVHSRIKGFRIFTFPVRIVSESYVKLLRLSQQYFFKEKLDDIEICWKLRYLQQLQFRKLILSSPAYSFGSDLASNPFSSTSYSRESSGAICIHEEVSSSELESRTLNSCLETLRDAIESHVDHNVKKEVISLIASELRHLVRISQSVSGVAEIVFKANKSIAQSKDLFPQYAIPRIEQHILGVDLCLEDCLRSLILPFVFDSSISSARRLSDIVRYVIQTKEKWAFLRLNREAFLRALLMQMNKEQDLTNPSEELKAIISQYQYLDMDTAILSKYGWSEQHIKILLARADRVEEVYWHPSMDLEGVTFSKQLKKLDLERNIRITNQMLASAIAHCTHLEDLNISCTTINLEGVEFPDTLRKLDLFNNKRVSNQFFISAIARCHRLETLNLGGTRITLGGIKLPESLRKLNLWYNEDVSNQSFKSAIVQCKDIEDLCLAFTKINLEGITSLTTLKKLDFERVGSVPASVIMQLNNLEELILTDARMSLEGVTFSEKLIRLDISGNSAITDQSLRSAIAQCENLEELVARKTNISLEGVHLPKTLKKLDLSLNDSVTDRSFSSAIAQCENLEELVVRRTNISLEGIHLPKTLKKLDLSLSGSITDQNLSSAIAECMQLEELILKETEISLAGIILPTSLRKLELCESTKVNNQSFRSAIARCEKLEDLSLRKTSVSLSGIVLPKTMKNLDLSDNMEVTDQTFGSAIALCSSLENLDAERTKISLSRIQFPTSLKRLNIRDSREVTDQTVESATANCENLEMIIFQVGRCITPSF